MWTDCGCVENRLPPVSCHPSDCYYVTLISFRRVRVSGLRRTTTPLGVFYMTALLFEAGMSAATAQLSLRVCVPLSSFPWLSACELDGFMRAAVYDKVGWHHTFATLQMLSTGVIVWKPSQIWHYVFRWSVWNKSHENFALCPKLYFTFVIVILHFQQLCFFREYRWEVAMSCFYVLLLFQGYSKTNLTNHKYFWSTR